MNPLTTQLPGSWLAGLKQRNELFDTLFYDVDALSQAEKDALSPMAEQESSLIVVPPTGANREIAHFYGLDAFLEGKDSSGTPLKDGLRIVALAGVGSSVLGTAALARNVADVYGEDVLGIVTGYGAADMLEEAMGGWFFYGAIDQADHMMRKTAQFWQETAQAWREMLTPQSKQMRARGLAAPAPTEIKTPHHRKRYTDVEELIRMLEEGHLPQLEMLVGHSKGSLLIDFAVETLVDSDSVNKDAYFDKLKLVTFGAVTDLPSQFEHRYQFIGSLDSFGGMNSRLDVPHETVDGAWHHLNEKLPFHMPLKKVLAQHVPLAP